MRTCPQCKETSDSVEFYTSTVKYCKLCWRVKTKAWRDNHRPRHLEIAKKCWDKNKDKYNIDRKLGGPSLYETLLKQQNSLCAICEQPEKSARYKTLAVDHCHSTGKIRGLLCSHCNRAIGLLKDNTKILEKAIQYLRGQVEVI